MSKQQQSQQKQPFVALATQSKPFERLLAIRMERAGSLTDPQIADIKTALVAVKVLWNEVETKRKAITDPINAGIKEVNRQAKEVKDPLERIERHCKMLLGAAQLVRSEAAEKAIEKQARAAEKAGDNQFAMDLRRAAADEATIAGGGVQFRGHWVIKNIDLDALLEVLPKLDGVIRDALRAAFLEAAMKVLGAVARSTKGQLTVRGVEIVEEKVIAVS